MRSILILFLLSGCSTIHPSPDAAALPVLDPLGCPSPSVKTEDGRIATITPKQIAEFHAGCRRNYLRPDYCAVVVIKYKKNDQSYGVICGIRKGSQYE